MESNNSVVPPETGIGDALPVVQLGTPSEDQLLAASDEKTLEHHSDDPRLSTGDAVGEITCHIKLPGMTFEAVPMTGIDDEATR